MTGLKIFQATYLSQLLMMIILGAMTGLVYMSLTPIWWLVFFAIALIIAIFVNNKIGIIFILATIFLFHWLFGVLRAIPKEITWLPDVVILIMTAKFLYLQTRKNQWQRTSADLVILILLLLGILSAIYNNVSVITVLFGLRKFFKYTLMFYILTNIETEERFYRAFLITLFILAMAQIPVTIIQAITYGAIGKDVADNISGTLGGKATGAMALFMCFASSVMMGYYTQTKKVIFPLICGISFIPIILGSGQYGLIIAPLAIMICWLMGKSFTAKNVLKLPVVIFLIIMIVIPGINYHDARYRGHLSKLLTSPSELYSLNMQTRKEGTFGRFQVVGVANELLSQSLPQFFIGFGPGNASESYFAEYSGRLDKEFQHRKIGGIQFASIVLEFGYIGLLGFLFLFYYLGRMNRQLYHQSRSQFWRSLSVGYNGMMFAYIAGILYNLVWFYDVLAFTFWFVTAALVVKKDLIDKTALNNNNALN